MPLACGDFSLREALDSVRGVRANQSQVPLIVKLIENPEYRVPGIRLFSGAVTLDDHDCIHALLGRGLLPKDEAFTIGYTMGSTKQAGAAELKLYSLAAKHLYPSTYRFTEDDIQVFRHALHLASISRCVALDEVDYARWMDQPLHVTRSELGIEEDLLAAYYRIEKARYPHSVESQRLL